MPKLIATEKDIDAYIAADATLTTGVYGTIVTPGLLTSLAYAVTYAGPNVIELHQLGVVTADSKKSVRLSKDEVTYVAFKPGLLRDTLIVQYGQEDLKFRIARFVVGHPGHAKRVALLKQAVQNFTGS